MRKSYSGATRSVFEYIRYFKNLGHEVHVVSEKFEDTNIHACGCTAHTTSRWPWEKHYKRRVRFSWEAQRLSEKIKPDLIIGHDDLQQQDILTLHVCVHLAHEKRYGKPLPANHELHLIHAPVLQNKQFRHLIANSDLMKNDLVNRFGISKHDITVIYPAIDESVFYNFAQNDKDSLKLKLGVKGGELIVGFITSGDLKLRGIDRYFAAINLLPAEIAEKTQFIFVGKDKLDSDNQTLLDNSPYKHRIKKLPVIKNVEQYFNALDILVHPSRFDTYGRVVPEAMACGAPVITTDWVGASEIMEDVSRDFIYPGDNNSVLADLIVKLLRKSELRKIISERNIKSVRKVFESTLEKKFDNVFHSYLH